MAVGMVSWLLNVFHAQLRMTFIILMSKSGILKFISRINLFKIFEFKSKKIFIFQHWCFENLELLAQLS